MADYFDGKPLNRLIESLYELERRGAVSLDGEEVKVLSGSKTETMQDIETLALCYGMTYEEALDGFLWMWMVGDIVYDDGFKVERGEAYDCFVTACGGRDVGEMLRKAAMYVETRKIK